MMVRKGRTEFMMIALACGSEVYLSTLATEGKNASYLKLLGFCSALNQFRKIFFFFPGEQPVSCCLAEEKLGRIERFSFIGKEIRRFNPDLKSRAF